MLSHQTAACLAVGAAIVRLERMRLRQTPARLVTELRRDLRWLIRCPAPPIAWNASPPVSITRRA